jgi:hypothetical protein
MLLKKVGTYTRIQLGWQFYFAKCTGKTVTGFIPSTLKVQPIA